LIGTPADASFANKYSASKQRPDMLRRSAIRERASAGNNEADWNPISGGMSRGLMTKLNIVENPHNKGSHRHFCEVGGHRYECGEDCVCICGQPMNGNDHDDCPVELRPCPEHEFEQKQSMSEEALPEGLVEIMFPPDWQHAALPHCECGCSEIDLNGVVGWCFHCDHVYANYTPELENRHFANHCPDAPETFKEAARARLANRGM